MTKQAEFFLSKFTEPGYAVDIGANDGIFLSNTLDLEKQGWRVLCIEANGFYGPSLWENRKEVVIGAVGATNTESTFYLHGDHEKGYASSSGLTIPSTLQFPILTYTLDWYLEKWNPPVLDIVTVDVEGGEEDVLRGFSIEKWRPKIICLEDWDGTGDKFVLPPEYKKAATFDYDVIFLRETKHYAI